MGPIKNNFKSVIYFMTLNLLFVFNGYANPLENKYPIIPGPQEISYGKGELTFKTIHMGRSDFKNESDLLRTFFKNEGMKESLKGLNIQIIKEHLSVDNPDEAYRLSIDNDIKIWATTERGAYYAIKTLQQIFRKHAKEGVFPKLEITDWPAFKIRGFMHDTGRNFQSVAQLKEQIEVISQYKYNVFHWHLTDDPGWRLESKLYPQLQSEDATSRGKGKFYTQEDFKDIVAFCKARHITVIPEFDIPGHSEAFRKAMGFESMKDERALPTLLNLFDELCTLVSAEDMPYIHIGTDEVRNREEYVEDGFVKQIMDRVKSHDRELIVWMEGIDVKGDSTSINQLWAQFNPREGHRFIDSRANYINHLDPFAGMSRLFFQQPCRQPKGDALALGGILCAWPDNNVANERDILKQNPIYPSIVFYADAIWKGRKENKLDYWAKLPPVNTTDLQEFKAFEDKVIVHRDLFFKGKEFPYIRQTDIQWNVIGPFPNHNDVSLNFPVEDSLVAAYAIDGKNYKWSEPKVGGTLHLKHFFGFPALTTEKTGTFYATTEIYSPDDRVQDFWVGFQGWSRSGGRRVGPFPDQGQWHTTNPKIWVNNLEIAPPVWKQPNLGTKTDEIPFIDEDYFYRSPTKIQLKKGWNTVLLKIPQDDNSWKWMFTCVPVDIKNNEVKEVSDLIFRPMFNVVPKVTLKSFPKDYQLYARDKNNKARIEISGTVESSVDSLITKVHGVKDMQIRSAIAVNGPFSMPIEIEALKHNYTIELFVKKKMRPKS
ncbi:family 20 glycosylhydrolase [Gelidibacter gilvus]|uniref:family 20 glycosylhydrolase n=1 Tax=Gelidibacter gilvus TaxID=59602 RepID=UPI001CB9C32F|nr:family 20 glycosylhydrolase [Gelidibacter gilvus]